MNWLLVAIIVVATTFKDILQAIAMRRHGEIHDFRPGALGRLLRLLAQNRNGDTDLARSCMKLGSAGVLDRRSEQL